MLELLSDSVFWIGFGTGGTLLAIGFIAFFVCLGLADERAEALNPSANLLAEEDFLRGEALNTPSPATQGRWDRAAGQRWPLHSDVDGFAQGRPS